MEVQAAAPRASIEHHRPPPSAAAAAARLCRIRSGSEERKMIPMRAALVLATLILLVTTPATAELSPGDRFAVAIERNDADGIRELLEKHPADTLIEYDEHKITPLIKAAWEGDAEITKILLDAGAKVNASATDTKETALLNAVKRGHTEVVDLLLKAGADITPADVFGFNAFTTAVAAGNKELAATLLEAGAKIDQGAHGLTPLMFAVSSGDVEMLHFLAKRGANVNYGAKGGVQSALHLAIYSAKPDMVKELIALKADVNAKLASGETPLMLAQKGDQTEIIEILKAAGAKK
jgi:ankyrin repeat protein